MKELKLEIMRWKILRLRLERTSLDLLLYFRLYADFRSLKNSRSRIWNEVAVDRHDPTIDQFENNAVAYVESNLDAPNPGHDVIGPESKAPSENESKACRPTSLDVEVNCQGLVCLLGPSICLM